MLTMKIRAAKTIDPLEDNKSEVTLLSVMGNDLAIVNDARVSYNKSSSKWTQRDEKLLNYLLQHKHYSPLRGCVMKFKIKAPLFVCRQFWKHVIASTHSECQLGWNEQSLRYTTISDMNEFYIPKKFRQQDTKNKQSSIGTINNPAAFNIYKTQCESSYKSYQELIEIGVCREQARAVLIPAIYVNWVWTASIQSIINFLDLRLGDGAQLEIVEYAKSIQVFVEQHFPRTITAWNKYK